MENKLDEHLKRVVLNNEFQGLMSFVVRDGDMFEIDASEYKIHHRLGGSRGKILGAWARCDRKGRNPFLIYLEFEEHKEETEAWTNQPGLMIQRKAEEFIIKRGFPVEEVLNKKLKENLISRPQQKRMFAISGGQEHILRQVLLEHGLRSTSEVSREEYEEICNKIEKLANEFTEVENIEHPW